MAVPASPDTAWPRELLDRALGDDVVALGTLRTLLAHPEWVHRRVDVLSYRDDITFRRRQSVYFTVPAAAPEVTVGEASFRLVPLTLLRKGTMAAFDCRDESGVALPVLTRYQQGVTMARGMTVWAEGIVGDTLAPEVAADIATLVNGAGPGVQAARARALARTGQWAALRDDEIYSVFLDRLVDQFVLVTLVHDGPGTQRIVKFSSDEVGEPAAEPWPRALAAALCWAPRRAVSPTEGLFSTESYHLEADLPPGVDIASASLWVGPADGALSCVDVDVVDRQRVALRTSGHDQGVAEARWSLLPARHGWLRTAWYATMLLAVTLVVGAWRLDTITAGEAPQAQGIRSDLAAAVVLTALGGLGGLVARIEEHPLVSRLLVWLRRMAAVASLLPLVAAGSLVVGPAGSARQALWVVLAAVAVVIAAAFTVAFTYPDRDSDHQAANTGLRL